ncbi:hypothetical protein SAMN05428945_6315 [Streptomyces sp. 2224.1]|uniref:hypothetical protein n=1 Tax=unclassified Streptomyces TaxID=2593676 RepID=UPI00088DFB17|nr:MULTISPECIES: hypothetical protein [unclassified Streptomyces]PBC86153.1 hypothetical protein BX261_6224 [Streptomyces sp. 2321.6]SDQ94660.1 hypothetical protein SAMN05216511_1030 [Streptomyces sp. KS_16]SED79045.1 hypothetical protein SAMN05428954_1005 [Streptomyces sp. 2112.3]SED89826.1 hypothetical protein SAMN05428940_6250 [Streptomyces sp. 2133.1]SED99499.1 hypothetical protein SAMN05428945_6315 [Streptomyces sp. 2224.1]
MNIEIHQLRHRELLREADHYRLARAARKTDPPAARAVPRRNPGPVRPADDDRRLTFHTSPATPAGTRYLRSDPRDRPGRRPPAG